jgi:choline kinase
MKVLILAAGQGTRLRPLTDDRPKCLAPLAGRTLLARQLHAWRACGITDITVVTGYRAEMIVPDGFRCCHNDLYDCTNMVASLFCAEAAMHEGEDLIISYGDVVFEERVGRSLIAAADRVSVVVDTGWRSLWELRMDDPLQDAETLKLTPQGYIRELGLKPGSYADIEGQYMGLIKVRGDAVGPLREAYHQMGADAHLYMTAFLQHLIDTGWRVRAVPVQNGWIEIDSLSDLHRYEALWKSGELRRFCNLDEAGTE